MNVEKVIKSNIEMPIQSKSIVHFILVGNKISSTLDLALKPLGVSLQQFNVLRILRGQKGVPANLSTINERMITKMSNTTRLIDKLIIKGYAKRITCESNRRKIEITITKKGEEELNKMDVTIDNTQQSLLQNLNTKDLTLLNTLLDKF